MTPSSPAPRPQLRYEQVKKYITDHITRGEWDVGERLPSESELVETLGVSRMTVHRALRELMTEGLVTRAQGVGTFVAELMPRAPLLELRDIADDIISAGHTHTQRLVTLEAVRADVDLAMAFDQRPGAKLFHSVIVHMEDNIPLQVEERYVSPHFAPDYLEQDFTSLHPHRLLTHIARPDEMEHVIFAVTPEEKIQQLLELDEPATACLQLVRRTWVQGKTVMKGIFTYPGNRYSLGGRYQVDSLKNH
ncbi:MULTISPECIES: histidine utilization repressor [Acetobacter]|uniref:Histidine utilization repressor n=1 Tax=Acetobacter thailandicus TaxID=1502842 RepID=A0ABT3QCW4_9PROT|nr:MULTISPECIES: histidine utilization repressor [Acetobacter]MBS0960476.1 histidine utilization repressor [Acetobacter thailandicus]MBS0979564.1 histidine utilization repressor [Acetobacter thailandicus]MBS0986103.1 histidine utilization repressor [Acetobacter thailandicus]MBS1004289.1 histidine utilization repressor [Acetobacter thailandicus]MCX2563137.1 histidine utilization repressor [Acetobacter thailandicus]